MVQDTSNSCKPSEELLSKIRILAQYTTELEDEKATYILERIKPLGERVEGVRDESLLALEKTLSDIRITSKRFLEGLFSKKHKAEYQVSQGEKVRLKFTDTTQGRGLKTIYNLEAVLEYKPGEWEQRLDIAYQECQDIQNLREQIPTLERKIEEEETPSEILALIERTPKPNYTINLLLLSPNYDSNSAILFGSYLVTGRVSEAIKIINDTNRLHPRDGQLKLSLGNVYLAALWNDRGWAPNVDPGPLQKITLDLLKCNYAIAAGSAEMLFEEAIKLTNDHKVITQAKEQLRTLKMMDDIYDVKGDK